MPFADACVEQFLGTCRDVPPRKWAARFTIDQAAVAIVATSFTPTREEQGRLAAVAAIRTFPSYFLDREVERAARSSHSAGPGAPAAPPARAD